MKNIYKIIPLFIIILTFSKYGKAQDSDRTLLRQVIKENQDAVDAVALYPSETRKWIFEAAEYPELIAKLNAMQKDSQGAFEKLISSFSQKDQEKIWNLTRYDGLISDLAKNPYQSDHDTYNILANYPLEIHATALEVHKKNYSLLVHLDSMNRSYNTNFESLFVSYPPEALNAFREIIKIPEVLSILFDHMQYTVMIGDFYKNNSELVMHKTDSLNRVLTQKNIQDANDWKQSLTDNPQVLKEFTQAAQEYAQDNGYQSEDYNASLTQEDILNSTANPFNWWFGYPDWYPYSSWNPYPYWYDWGYYYGSAGQVIVFGLPSFYYMNWYFYYPEHCSKYAELSNLYFNYCNNHQESTSYNSISHNVNLWRIRNKDIVTDAWAKDDVGRIQRFKEFGQMETERKAYNNKNPHQQVNQAEFVQKNAEKYTLLSGNISKNQSDMKINNATNPSKTEQKPLINGSPSNQNNSRQTSVNNNQQRNSKPQENFNQIRNAQEYHQNSWNQIQSQPSAPQAQQSGRRR